jgi:hypothetical protein
MSAAESSEETVPVIEYGGREFTCPFVDLLPAQSVEDMQGLEDSIKEDGVLYPIILNQDDVLIDGHTRLALAIKNNVPIEQIPFLVCSADYSKSEELALTLNYARRKITPEDRAKLVKKLKSEGWTERRIAKALRVGSATIHYDLKGRPPAPKPTETPQPKDDDSKPGDDPLADQAPGATGDIESDWGLSGEGEDGGPVPGDDLAAEAKRGATAAGQLARALNRLSEMTPAREQWLQGITEVFKKHAGLVTAEAA